MFCHNLHHILNDNVCTSMYVHHTRKLSMLYASYNRGEQNTTEHHIPDLRDRLAHTVKYRRFATTAIGTHDSAVGRSGIHITSHKLRMNGRLRTKGPRAVVEIATEAIPSGDHDQ